MTSVVNRSPEHQLSQPQSPASQMSVNRIMDSRSQPHTPTAARQLPLPSTGSNTPPSFKSIHHGRAYRYAVPTFTSYQPHQASKVTVNQPIRNSLEIVQQPIRARMCGFGDKVCLSSPHCFAPLFPPFPRFELCPYLRSLFADSTIDFY